MDLQALFGSEEAQTQLLTLYLPNKDRDGKEIPDFNDWVRNARMLLTVIGEGATALPPADGTWLINKDADVESINENDILWEKTVVIYTYIDIEDDNKFMSCFLKLKGFLYDFGKSTNQACVIFEFDGKLYKLRNFKI